MQLLSNLSCTKLNSINITSDSNGEIENESLKDELFDEPFNTDVFFEDIEVIKQELNTDEVSVASSDDEPLSLCQAKKRGRKKKVSREKVKSESLNKVSHINN